MKKLQWPVTTFFSYFGHIQNYLYIEGNLKIVVYLIEKHQRDNNITTKEQGWLKIEKIKLD